MLRPLRSPHETIDDWKSTAFEAPAPRRFNPPPRLVCGAGGTGASRLLARVGRVRRNRGLLHRRGRQVGPVQDGTPSNGVGNVATWGRGAPLDWSLRVGRECSLDKRPAVDRRSERESRRQVSQMCPGAGGRPTKYIPLSESGSVLPQQNVARPALKFGPNVAAAYASMGLLCQSTQNGPASLTTSDGHPYPEGDPRGRQLVLRGAGAPRTTRWEPR